MQWCASVPAAKHNYICTWREGRKSTTLKTLHPASILTLHFRTLEIGRKKKNLNSLGRVAMEWRPEFLQVSWSQSIMDRRYYLAYIHHTDAETSLRGAMPCLRPWPVSDKVTAGLQGVRSLLCNLSHFFYAVGNPILLGLVNSSKPDRWERTRGIWAHVLPSRGAPWDAPDFIALQPHPYDLCLLPRSGRGRSAGGIWER